MQSSDGMSVMLVNKDATQNLDLSIAYALDLNGAQLACYVSALSAVLIRLR